MNGMPVLVLNELAVKQETFKRKLGHKLEKALDAAEKGGHRSRGCFQLRASTHGFIGWVTCCVPGPELGRCQGHKGKTESLEELVASRRRETQTDVYQCEMLHVKERSYM